MRNFKSFWIFRIASKIEDGGGHIMRTLSLAIEMSQYVDVHFLLDDDSEKWKLYLNSKGFSVESFSSIDNLELRNPSNCIGVLIDSYKISIIEMEEWKLKYRTLAFIDDFAMFPIFPDFLICPSIYLKNKAASSQQISLFGPKYALLSSEYSNYDDSINLPESVKVISMSFGFFDSRNCIQIALQALNKTKFNGKVNIAIGSKARFFNDIKNRINDYQFTINLYEDLDGLCEFFLNSDIVIGSGGLSLLERMSLGKPSITFISATNQINQVNWADSKGATISFQINEVYKESDIINKINLLIFNKTYRHRMSRIARELVDGNGAKRVAKVLISNTTDK